MQKQTIALVDDDRNILTSLSIALEKEGFKVASMTITSIWEPDFNLEAKLVYGTLDQSHPAVNYLFNFSNKVYIGGEIEKISMPNHYDYRGLRLNPSLVKKKFKDLFYK